jgi:sec-independent protein translocase protein TatA
MNMGTPEIMMILFVVLLLFGGKKLPELARGLGKGIREFKDASDDVKREIHNNINKVTEDMDAEKSESHSDESIPKISH